VQLVDYSWRKATYFQSNPLILHSRHTPWADFLPVGIDRWFSAKGEAVTGRWNCPAKAYLLPQIAFGNPAGRKFGWRWQHGEAAGSPFIFKNGISTPNIVTALQRRQPHREPVLRTATDLRVLVPIFRTQITRFGLTYTRLFSCTSSNMMNST
jgi:hypothetical protein